ncbi:MAG: PfkB family carbohydrate kinase [Pseudomonadota bacterium]
MTGRLIQLSGVIIDHIYKVETVPTPGTEALVHEAWLEAGGGFNAMAAARRCGMAVVYAGTLGTGPFANVAADVLKAEGINILQRRKEGMDQGCCTVLVDRNGERSFIAMPGADGHLDPADLEAIPHHPDDWFLLSGYALGYPGSRVALTAWLASAAQDVRFVFDPCPLVAQIPKASRQAALDAATWITANIAEAEFLTGHGAPEPAAAELAAGRPSEGGAILRDGANGCYLAVPGRPVVHVPGFPVRAVDTNGAGDTHAGAFIAMLARGEDPTSAASIANVCAAISTTREGASTAPTLEEAKAAMAANHEPKGIGGNVPASRRQP